MCEGELDNLNGEVGRKQPLLPRPIKVRKGSFDAKGQKIDKA